MQHKFMKGDVVLDMTHGIEYTVYSKYDKDNDDCNKHHVYPPGHPEELIVLKLDESFKLKNNKHQEQEQEQKTTPVDIVTPTADQLKKLKDNFVKKQDNIERPVKEVREAKEVVKPNRNALEEALSVLKMQSEILQLILNKLK